MACTDFPPGNPPLRLHTTVVSLREHRQVLAQSSKTIGFVPTMGALHAGHLALVHQAAFECDSITVSIFVNPVQFAPTEDLATYPRTLAADVEKLVLLNTKFEALSLKGRVEAVFVPNIAEIYPGGIQAEQSQQRGAFVTVEPLAKKLEGITRPHFFRGVATVCMKLFNIVQPHRAYFGQKDVQQTVVLKRMVRDFFMSVEIKVCGTTREDDGLAMSSRNVYLGKKRRAVAPVLYKALKAAEAVYFGAIYEEKNTVKSMKLLIEGQKVLEKSLGENGVFWEVEYFSLADNEELEELEEVDINHGAIISAALKMMPTQEDQSPVRLIDNIILSG